LYPPREVSIPVTSVVLKCRLIGASLTKILWRSSSSKNKSSLKAVVLETDLSGMLRILVVAILSIEKPNYLSDCKYFIWAFLIPTLVPSLRLSSTAAIFNRSAVCSSCLSAIRF
jgi:hypothetical protein